MKIAVFGGTGRTGQHIIEQAIEMGYEVNLLARTPSKVSVQNERIHIVQGDILDPDAVEQVIQGVDAVVSVLGPTENKPTFTISRGTDNILTAMKKHDVRRLVISAGAGVRDPQDKPKLIDRFFGVLL
ncbi:MAG: NmrA family transcriptional regulator, partial [Phototrophicales bacterium]